MVLSYSFLDLHAGLGSTALGFLRAGFRCIGLLEESKRAAVVLRENFPPMAAPLLGAGPREGDPAKLPLQRGLLEERPDVVVGAPLWRRPKGKKVQGRIFGTYTALRHLRPKAILLHFPGGGEGLEALNYLSALLMEEGYRVHPAKLDGSWYGLPKKQEILVLLALSEEVPDPIPGCWPPPRLFHSPGEREREEDLPPGIEVPPPPRKPPFRPLTVEEALEGLTPESSGPGGTTWYARLMQAWIPCGGEAPSAGGAGSRGKPAPGKRMGPREGAPPGQGSPSKLREKARLQSLPDGYHFRGTPSWARALVEESLPPLMALVLARAVRSILDGVLPPKGFLPEARGEAAPLPEIPFPAYRETRRPTW